MRLRIGLRAVLAFAVAVATLGATAAASARFPFPIPVGNAQDAAVRAALSGFGKAIGDQLPIVVNPTDALPTADLPGSPFAPGEAPNLAAALKASTSGTVELAPGDYQFIVDVFCMRATAHSPSGHRYLVAPLRGGEADIFTALNARAPSYHPNHMQLQVLSWEMQAGMPYGQMQGPQRALVDQIIPDYRERLKGDVLAQMQATYQTYVGRVPGMPSFNDALTRIGPVGQDVIAMQQLRKQMAQPPPTVQQLIQELVPYAPLEPGGSGPTPWSRYSDRVYVRFVTSGNFATPGMYEVRVLAPSQTSGTTSLALGPPDAGAPVPFSNIVNNPGTSSVQPLTQGPQPGNGPPPNPQPSPTATPSASISSETYATDPSDRSRTTVGVNEPVKLTFSGADASWTIAGGAGTLDQTTGKVVEYKASITPATETITAIDTKTHAQAQITFGVIRPSGLYFERVPGTSPQPDFYHHVDWPDIGFGAKVYLQPDTVSFEYIDVREREAFYTATGYYGWMNGQSHDPAKEPESVTHRVPGKGWELANADSVWSGRQEGRTFTPGHETIVIPWEYTSVGSGESGTFYYFAQVVQECVFESDAKTLSASKGNEHFTLQITSPNYK